MNKKNISPPLNYPIPEKGHLTRLADDLYWGRFDLPFRLNHINLYMIDTQKGWVLIDAGLHETKTQNHWQSLLNGPLKRQPVSKIIVSHHHIDHIGNAAWLNEKTNAPVFASPGEIKQAKWLFNLPEAEFSAIMAKTYTRYGLPKANIDHVKNGGSRFRNFAPKLPNFQVMQKGDLITSRNGTWKARCDRGHSHDHISLIDKERKLYIAMDFLMPRISPNISADISNIDDDRLGAYLAYLNEMSRLDNDIKIFPGHDWPFDQGGTRAKALITHHNERLNMLLDALANKPLTTDDAMAVLFGRAFEPHELYFASGEARAHLNHLTAQGAAKMESTSHDPHSSGADRFYLNR